MKFSVGEVVVYVGPEYSIHPIRSKFPVAYGDYVLLGRRLVSPIDGSTAYDLCSLGGEHLECATREINLRKRPYKDQHTPAEQSFSELISSLKGVGV